MCQDVCLLPPLRKVLLEGAAAQNLWFSAPNLAHFPSLPGKLAAILSPSWVWGPGEVFFFFCL